MAKASRDKGARWERACARLLGAWLGDEYTVRRNPADRQRGETGDAGDLVILGAQPFPFAVECKHSEQWTPWSLLEPIEGGSGVLAGFWAQALEQADLVDLRPLLLCKRDRRPPLALLYHADLAAMLPPRASRPVEVRNGRISAIPLQSLLDVDPCCLLELPCST